MAQASPRTMEKIAKSMAFNIVQEAQITKRAMAHDRKLEKEYKAYEKSKELQNRSIDQKIVDRQRLVHQTIEARQREMREEEEEARISTRQMFVETARQEVEELKLSARSQAAFQATQYQQHLEEMERREREKQKLGDDAYQKLVKQQAQLDAAQKRAEQIRHQQAAKVAESRKLFDQRREMIREKQLENVRMRDKAMKEFLKKEKEVAARSIEHELRKNEEWERRARQTDELLLATTRSHHQSLEQRHQRLAAHWDESLAATDQRLQQQHSARKLRAESHAKHYDEVKRHNLDSKAHIDDEKESRMMEASLKTEGRIRDLERKKVSEMERESKLTKSDFHLKSGLEQLEWDAAVNKYDPGRVRSGLSAVKAPIPSGV